MYKRQGIGRADVSETPLTVTVRFLSAGSKDVSTVVGGVAAVPAAQGIVSNVDTSFDASSRDLTTTVDGVSDTTNLPTTLSTSFSGRYLTVTVNEQGETVTIPEATIPPTTVDTSYDTNSNTFTTTVDGVTDTTVIPRNPTTVDASFDDGNRTLMVDVSGVTDSVSIPCLLYTSPSPRD